MSDPKGISADSATMDFRFGIDDGRMELQLDLEPGHEEFDPFVSFYGTFKPLSLPAFGRVLNSLFSLDAAISDAGPARGDDVSHSLMADALARGDAGCFPEDAQRRVFGDLSMRTGAFVFGSVTTSMDSLFPDGLDASSLRWDANASRLSCMPGITADF